MSHDGAAVEDAIDLESVEDIQQDLHEKHWPVGTPFLARTPNSTPTCP